MRLAHTITGSGPPIVFLHGVGSSSATWADVAERLSPDFTCIRVDLLGHGDSPVPDDPAEYTRDRALDDIDDLLVTLDQSAILVGHSLGGYLALAHAATRPNATRGIVVLNTGPGFRDPAKREAWNERSRRNAHRFGVPPQAAELNLQEDGVVMERLADIAVPALVLAGSADRAEYTGAGQYIERKMANARFVSVDGGEHAMHEETHADEVAALIADFARSND